MILGEHFASALGQIWVNKFRAVLTTLGIIIAVAAVIAVVSILEGMTSYVGSFIEGMGSSVVWIQPDVPPEKVARGVLRSKLSDSDVEGLERECASIEIVAPVWQQQAMVRSGDREETLLVLATTEKFQRIRNWYVGAGRFLSSLDELYGSTVCVLGADCLDELGIASGEALETKVRIGGRIFQVVGVLERKGSFLGQAQDEMIVIPYKTARKVFGSSVSQAVTIVAQARSTQDADRAKSELRRSLRSLHELKAGDPDDFKIQSQDEVLQFFEKSSRLATFVLAGVVGISLVVGGIGIMNIMLVSVTERTREIGILKALGARDKDVLIQFMIEAVLLSLVGGVIGILLGIGAAFAVTAFAPIPEAKVPLWSIGLGFAFSTGVGIFFGMYPAVQAARLNPIEALRYE